MSGSNIFTGTLDILVLRAVQVGPLHGYAVGQWIKQHSRDELQVEEGVLYPALHRLARRGLLDARWGRTDTGRRARFYTLTPAGRQTLAEERARWTRHVAAVNAALESPEA
jgi:transcriptional regulator